MYKAFMHLFHMNDKYYVYDVNTKVVLNISKNIYIFLVLVSKWVGTPYKTVL